jgi:hypothetical protein
MAGDDKKTKTSPAPKTEVAAKKTEVAAKKEAPATKKDDSSPKDKSTSGADLSKAAGGEKTADTPSGYSRGEGQKAVTQAYKDNWNAIYAKNKKKKKKR